MQDIQIRHIFKVNESRREIIKVRYPAVIFRLEVFFHKTALFLGVKLLKLKISCFISDITAGKHAIKVRVLCTYMNG